MNEPQQPDAQEGHEPIAREGEHVAPEFEKRAYHCPTCGVLAPMNWSQMQYGPSTFTYYAQAWHVQCGNCQGVQYWVDDTTGAARMVSPDISGGPRPHVDMPDDVRK